MLFHCSLFFFFQAEDGIRDLYVTGVQTCALPISKDEDGKAVKPKRASLPKGVAPDEIELDRAVKLLALPRVVGKHPDDGEDRSEERRVGKEGRCRRGAYS